jgi:hypothetical protein
MRLPHSASISLRCFLAASAYWSSSSTLPSPASHTFPALMTFRREKFQGPFALGYPASPVAETSPSILVTMCLPFRRTSAYSNASAGATPPGPVSVASCMIWMTGENSCLSLLLLWLACSST